MIQERLKTILKGEDLDRMNTFLRNFPKEEAQIMFVSILMRALKPGEEFYEILAVLEDMFERVWFAQEPNSRVVLSDDSYGMDSKNAYLEICEKLGIDPLIDKEIGSGRVVVKTLGGSIYLFGLPNIKRQRIVRRLPKPLGFGQTEEVRIVIFEKMGLKDTSQVCKDCTMSSEVIDIIKS